MNKEEALRALEKGNAHERFMAANLLIRLAQDQDLVTLRRLQHFENDAFVKKRLDAVINRISSASLTLPETDAYEVTEDMPLLRNTGVEWTSSMLLHEVGSKLGLIALSVSREIANYETSQTHKYVKHLQAVFDAIEHLKSVNTSPKMEDFDLPELIEEVVNFELDGVGLDVLRVGLRPLVVQGDRKFVELALCNGLRNAVEAIKQMTNLADNTGNVRKESIVISWGKTNKDYWISIIDSGPGLLSKNVFNEAGKSTKAGHSGYGLQISKQAMERLGGSLSLLSSNGGGATYLMRWNQL